MSELASVGLNEGIPELTAHSAPGESTVGIPALAGRAPLRDNNGPTFCTIVDSIPFKKYQMHTLSDEEQLWLTASEYFLPPGSYGTVIQDSEPPLAPLSINSEGPAPSPEPSHSLADDEAIMLTDGAAIDQAYTEGQDQEALGSIGEEAEVEESGSDLDSDSDSDLDCDEWSISLHETAQNSSLRKPPF